MDSRRTVLAALAASPDGTLSRVQAQKLLFLIDRSLSEQLGGRAFRFEPYHYGPFDKAVYWVMDDLVSDGLVTIQPDASSGANYALTHVGRTAAESVLASLPRALVDRFQHLASWVRRTRFAELVESIYQMFPEMRVNSIFRR